MHRAAFVARFVTEAEVMALLDAHDALVKACIDGSLAFDEFVLAYGEFPRGHGLDGGAADVQATLDRFRRRVGFHAQVAGLLSSYSAVPGTALGLAGAGGFLSKAVLLRLRQLVARHPDLTGF